jgi:muramoyltetrapeptide carboxypeptidase LdcA involved in peptidoglycan recycling
VEGVLVERLRPLGVPTVAGVDVGHPPSAHSVPFGVMATLDTDGPSLAPKW